MILTQEKSQSIVDSFSKLSPILVVGDLGIDKYTFGEVRRISPEAPVPVLEVSKEWDKLGLALLAIFAVLTISFTMAFLALRGRVTSR